MCMRASGASELRKCWHFYILNLLFLSIFCRYIRYFVGTLTCFSAHMYRQISKCTDKFPNVPTKIRKSIIGGGGAAPPPACPPPPLATLMFMSLSPSLPLPHLAALKFPFLLKKSPLPITFSPFLLPYMPKASTASNLFVFIEIKIFHILPGDLTVRSEPGGGALDFQMVGVCRWGVENRTLS